MAKRSFDDRFWNDRHGKLAIWQRPNIPLWIWIATIVLDMLLPSGRLQHDIGAIGRLAILVWAVMEVGWGDAYFRRLLGAGVLLLTLVSALK